MANFEDFTVFDTDYLTRSGVNEAAIAALRAGEVEARRIGSDVLDDRLVLVGLMADDNNLAAKTVRQLGETPERIRFAARALVEEPPFSDHPQSAPDAQVLVAEEVRQLCRLAMDEMRRLGLNKALGPQHLLVAMTRDDETSAGRLLRQAGFTRERTLRAMYTVLGMPS